MLLESGRLVDATVRGSASRDEFSASIFCLVHIYIYIYIRIYGLYPPIMENQMEKKMENEMETAIFLFLFEQWGFILG